MRDGKARVPTPEEQERLFAVASVSTHAARNTAMLMLSYGLGMRVGEIGSLNIEDVLTDEGKIKDSFTLKAKNTKSKRSRELYISNAKVKKALGDYIKYLRSIGDVYVESALFVSQKGNRLNAKQLGDVLATLYRKAGLNGCKSHSGRRTFATRLLQKNTDIRSVQALMGHASINQTAAYADTSPAILKKASEDAV